MNNDDPLMSEVRRLVSEQRFQQAIERCAALTTARPGDPSAWMLLAEAQLGVNAYVGAERSLARAVALEPGLEETLLLRLLRTGIAVCRLNDEARALRQQGRMSDAVDHLKRAAELAPDYQLSFNRMGDLQMALGNLDEAIESFRAASEHRMGSHRVANSNLLFAMLHTDRYSPQEILAEHRTWLERHAPAVQVSPPVIADPDPNRPIRVGYISPDFRWHPIALFMLAVLTNHDRERFNITCYADGEPPDDMGYHLRGLGHQWLDSAAMDFHQLFARVRQDRIDILIDLAVHSGFNRQRLLSARPAPIQMTWLGYAGTTGSPAVDYRITDAVVDPPGLTESHFTEQLLRLPDTLWCFTPPPGAPDIAPHDRSQAIRFGTATRAAKISQTTLDVWSSLLRAVPDSNLTIAAEPFVDPALREKWLNEFARRQVDPRRIELRPATRYLAYLEFLGTLDIGLDTFPFNGGTTVCQQLWTGTPIVALMGNTSRQRVTGSILHAIGHDDWIANTPEQWLEINRTLALDRDALAAHRMSLRDRMQTSALCDGVRFTRNLEAAFREVFRQRVSTQ